MSLLSLEGSAYRARLYGEGEGFYLFTESSAFHLVPGAAAKTLPLPPSDKAIGSPGGYAVWVDGAVELLDLHTGARRRRVALAEEPRALAAWHDAVAWSLRSREGTSLLASDVLTTPVYRSEGSIEAITLVSDWLFFVERLADARWRIGAVPTAGGKPRFTATRHGRTPAMLVHSDEALYYYDGNGFEVRKLAPDLQQETVIARGGVCSPLAVAGSVFCARVEGVFEMVTGEPARPLAPGRLDRLVTGLAATTRHVAWVSEAGPDRLEVHAVERLR